MRAVLFASATAATLVARLASSWRSHARLVPWRCAWRMTAIAPTTSICRKYLAAARVLLRHEADPGREITTRPEHGGISHARNERAGEQRTDSGNGHQSAPDLRLHADLAARQSLEERQDAASGQLPPHDHRASRINPVDLKHRLRDVEPDRHNCFHDGSSSGSASDHYRRRGGEPSTTSKAE